MPNICKMMWESAYFTVCLTIGCEIKPTFHFTLNDQWNLCELSFRIYPVHSILDARWTMFIITRLPPMAVFECDVIARFIWNGFNLFWWCSSYIAGCTFTVVLLVTGAINQSVSLQYTEHVSRKKLVCTIELFIKMLRVRTICCSWAHPTSLKK